MILQCDLGRVLFQATCIFLGHIATIDSASDIIPNCIGLLPNAGR